MITIFDVMFVLLVVGFGIYGQVLGSIPVAANLIILIISGMLSVSLGCLINLPVLEVVQEPTISTLISTLFILIFFERTLKVLFIPKNLAKEIYIDSPLYYVPGLFIGMLHGYIFYSILSFSLIFGGNPTIKSKADDSILARLTNFGYNAARFFVINRFGSELEGVFEKFNNKTHSKKQSNQAHQYTDPETQGLIDSASQKDDHLVKTLNILRKMKDVTEDEVLLFTGILNKLNSQHVYKIHQKLSSMQKEGTITKDASLYIITQSLALAAKEEGLLPSSDENKLIIKTSFDVFLKTNQEQIVSMFGKKPLKSKTPVNTTPSIKNSKSTTEKVFITETIKEFESQEEYELPVLQKNKRGRKKNAVIH